MIELGKDLKKLTERPFKFAYASVNSSMIEGNNINFDTYLKFVSSGMNTNSKSMREIESLKKAYEFASVHSLNKANILAAHKILSKDIVEEEYQGVIRVKDVYVFGKGELVYTGAKADIVYAEMDKLSDDIKTLKTREMSLSEVFYYASMIHLVVVKIHPFADGNGRIARLVEKWFLAQKLGKSVWDIASEELYRTRIKSYYKNVDIGKDYEKNDFDLCIPFLKMLPKSLEVR